jgi:cyanophycin synthetase
MLYPPEISSRIPLVAVTGTNGKTTVVQLLSYFATKAGYRVGAATTEGIYIEEERIIQGDCSGPVSARRILSDPAVDFAILECARGGILREGLGFDACDISIITNISEDHLGLGDIHTLEDLAEVKEVVAKSTCKNGYAILNAEDDLVFDFHKNLTCRMALFGLNKNERIDEHCQKGGLAAFVEKDCIVIQEGKQKHYLGAIKEMPITLQGSAICMIKNILPVVLAAFISRFPLPDIIENLLKLEPTNKFNPGRMNIFDFDEFKVMVDYAHNEGAFREIKSFLEKTGYRKKIGIIAAVGDRREEDIKNLGALSAQIFDEIIIRHNQDGRGKTNAELTNLLMQGIHTVIKNPKVTVISDELEAIAFALNQAGPDSFIYWAVDEVDRALHYMLKEKKTLLHSDRIIYHDTQRETLNHWRG